MSRVSPSDDELATVVAELRERVATLERENADLRRQLAALLDRQDKTPPAPPPFVKPAMPKRRTKKPGRPVGHPPALRPPPPEIHQEVDVPLPASGAQGEAGPCRCPRCQGVLEDLRGHRRVVEDIVDFLEIERYRKLPVGILPYGIKKRVELGRALAMEPRLLLLDEPVSGMNVEETEDMARFILDIREELAVAMILVEHDMGVVMDLADRVLALDFGIPIAVGPPAAIQHHPDVIRAYLGEQYGKAQAASAEAEPAVVESRLGGSP